LIKDILVAALGDEGDPTVFATAMAFARPMQAHLDFYHVFVTRDQTAVFNPRVYFAQGGVENALTGLQREAKARLAAARTATMDFCAREKIPIVPAGSKSLGLSASFIEDFDDIVERFILQARRHDLVVVSRPHGKQSSVGFLIEQLLLSCGRPVVIAPSTAPQSIRVALVGWKEAREAGLALSAAIPVLQECRQVIVTRVLTSVDEDVRARRREVEGVAHYLARHGVDAMVQVVRTALAPADALLSAAEEANADLLIAGAYGRSRFRELMVGGTTTSLLERANLPIFLLH
jgi:nucleotide-binding universal stress UspA family protein